MAWRKAGERWGKFEGSGRGMPSMIPRRRAPSVVQVAKMNSNKGRRAASVRKISHRASQASAAVVTKG